MGCLCGKGPVSHQDPPTLPSGSPGCDLSRACSLPTLCVGPVMSGFHGTWGGNYGL